MCQAEVVGGFIMMLLEMHCIDSQGRIDREKARAIITQALDTQYPESEDGLDSSMPAVRQTA